MSDRGELARRLIPGLALLLPALLWMQLPRSLDGMDGVGFALALTDYDPGLEQPHPPGYPLYIFLCRGFAALGLGEVESLALPGILAAPLLVLCVARIGRGAGLSPAAQLGGVLWMALHPLLLVEGPRPAPDLLGTAAVWGALALALERHFLVSGAVLGLALGVRPDLAPFGVLVVGLDRAARARWAGGLMLGVCAWLAPLSATMPTDWLERGAVFARGHFSVWGSSALAGAGDSHEVLRGLSLAASGPAGAALAWLGARRVSWPRALLLPLCAGAVWIALGQNLAHARHWLPLAPALALFGTAGLASLPRPRVRVGVVAAGVLFAIPGLYAAQRARLDGAEFVMRAIEACGDCDAVYAGASARLFERYAPSGFPTYRRTSLAAIRLDLEAWGLDRARLLATDEIPGAARRGVRVAAVGPIGLYRIEPAALR